MTNLLEKSLITGFGILVLIIFIILTAPFFNQIEEFKENDEKDIDNYMDFVERLDNAILSVVENPDITYKDDIQCYETLDLIIEGNQIKIYFKLEDDHYYKIIEYKSYFCNYTYDALASEVYSLEILFINNYSFIDVVFSL
jgi:hypothetical protein